MPKSCIAFFLDATPPKNKRLIVLRKILLTTLITNEMKKTAAILLGLIGLAGPIFGQFTTNLVIDGSSRGLSQPGDLGRSSILDYTIDEFGLLNLNHAFANSGGAGVGVWGDALDFTGASGLSAGVSTFFQVRIYSFNNNGAEASIKSNEDLGLGVQGNNPGRIDWGKTGVSESFQFAVNATNLPSNLKLVFTGLTFGNANATAVAQPEPLVGNLSNMTGFTGSLGTLTPNTPLQALSLGTGIEIVGGSEGSFTLSQANQDPNGIVGFNLQGLTFDVVPVAVPEPTTIGLGLGALVLGAALWRRRDRSHL